MFGIGGTEILVILVVALLLFGPQKLPDLARTLGKALGEFRRVSTDFQRTLNTEIETEEHEKRKKQAEEELFGEKAKPSGHADPARAPGEAGPEPSGKNQPASEQTVIVDATSAPAAAPDPRPEAASNPDGDNGKGAA